MAVQTPPGQLALMGMMGVGSVHAQGGHSVDLLTHTGHLHTVLSVLNASYSETFFLQNVSAIIYFQEKLRVGAGPPAPIYY